MLHPEEEVVGKGIGAGGFDQAVFSPFILIDRLLLASLFKRTYS